MEIASFEWVLWNRVIGPVLQLLIQALLMIGLDLYCKATFCIYDLLKSKTVWSYRDFPIYIEDFWNYITKGKWVLISSIQKWKCFVLVTTSLPLSDIRRYFVLILYKLIYLTLCQKACTIGVHHWRHLSMLVHWSKILERFIILNRNRKWTIIKR